MLTTVARDVAGYWDRAGVAGSVLCIAHCILTPFLAAVLPILAATEKGTHIGLTLGLMLVGALAFLSGYRRHRKRHLALVAGSGFAMLCLAAFAPEGMASEEVETALTVTGGMCLVFAHLRNAYYCRRCRVCAEDPCCAEP